MTAPLPDCAPSPLRLARGALEALAEAAARCAPSECCGALVGLGDEAFRFVPLRNVAHAPSRAFAFDDAEWLRVARATAGEGLDLVGIAHSHVDAPAEPSGADRALGDAARWMLIVPVWAGRAGTPRAFRTGAGGLREAAVLRVDAEGACR